MTLKKELSTYVAKNYTFKLSPKNKSKLMINDVETTDAGFARKLASDDFEGLDSLVYIQLLKTNATELKQMYKSIFADVLEVHLRALPPKEEVEDAFAAHFEGLTLCVNLSRNKEYVLIDEKSEVVSSIDPLVFREVYGDKLFTVFKQAGRPCIFKYQPYTLQKMRDITFKDTATLEVNQCLHPAWRYDLAEGAKMPPAVAEFFNYFIPDLECQTYVFNWMRNAVFERSETYLVLNGVMGAGKGLFCKLMTSLVGANNTIEAPRSFLTKEFNKLLQNKRIVILDEFKIREDDRSLLKKYINSVQNLEGKNLEADINTEIFCSYIISNNHSTDIKIRQDDRRFSVIDLVKTPMKKVFTDEAQKIFHERFEDDYELIRDFGSWLYSLPVTYGAFADWKGAHFKYLTYTSLASWQSAILRMFTENNGGEVELPEVMSFVKEAIGRYTPTREDAYIEFVGEFLHNGEPVARVEKENEIWVLYPNESFKGGSK